MKQTCQNWPSQRLDRLAENKLWGPLILQVAPVGIAPVT